MATLQDVAQGLKTGDVRAMATALGLNPPISLLALIRAFVQAAQPKVSVNLSPTGDNVPIAPPLLSWEDPCGLSFCRATSFGVEFDELHVPTQQDPSLYYVLLNVEVPATSLAYPQALKSDTQYELKVNAANKYGTSGTAYTEFHTVSVSQPPPPSPISVDVVLEERDRASAEWMYYDKTYPEDPFPGKTIKKFTTPLSTILFLRTLIQAKGKR